MRTLFSSSIVLISGVNCDRSGKVSEISANFSSKASSFTDAGSLTRGGKAGDSCLDILDPKEEVVLLAVPVLEGTSLAGSFPRPWILSGAIVDVNIVFGPSLRGPSPMNGGKDGMGGGGDGGRGGIEPAKDAVIGGRLSNSGNAGGIETTLVYWRWLGFASESASSPLFSSPSGAGLGTDREGDDTREGASALSGAAAGGEKGFGRGLSNDVCNRNGCELKAEGASERPWEATSRSF